MKSKAIQVIEDRTVSKKEFRETIQASMRLFVLVEESLRAGGGADTSLCKAIHDHAQLCGSVLPNNMRMLPKEIEAIRCAARMPKLDISESSLSEAILPTPGNPVILKSGALGEIPGIEQQRPVNFGV